MRRLSCSDVGGFTFAPGLARPLNVIINVISLGFVGALVQNHLDDGGFFDAPRFDPSGPPPRSSASRSTCTRAHPPADESRVNFDGGDAWGWGWHSRTGLHFLRLFAAGVFDHFPRLQLVLGHMGEMLPFMLDRVDGGGGGRRGRRRGLREVWDANVWVTTSGMFSLAPMACLLREMRAERILFSVDYPFSGNAEGRAFMDELRGSGLVSEAEWEGIAWKNVKGLLKLDPEPGDTEQGQVAY
ncbi:hypothetical protein LZ31DRAFT_593280 [Colletotrichum somersetense]|nr:hypothetical protein LZ31DRAFT_593280 [Colletotrichum somersetense]